VLEEKAGSEKSNERRENKDMISAAIFSGPPWVDNEAGYQLVMSEDHFVPSHVGDEIHFYGAVNGTTLRLRILEFISATQVLVYPDSLVPVELQNVAILTWAHAKSFLRNLDHLEGRTVSVFADAKVHPQVVVTNGTITLDYAASVIIVGLPITADFQTLSINLVAPGSNMEKQKNTFAVRMMVQDSRGIFAGRDFSPDHLMEMPQRFDENYDDPVRPFSGIGSVRVPSTWEPGGRICVRQSDPLPLAILAVMPDLDVGGAK
jgi:hypothetical protein